jgi:hypothetical protein
MHPAFASIQFGPFASTYHRDAVRDDFKEALSTFLEAELLPQVEQPYDSTTGRFIAFYDDQTYCGPRSAVRDIYSFEFAFQRPSGDDTVKVALVFHPATQAFTTRDHRPLYLWTASRRQRYQQEGQAIQQLCRRIAEREHITAICPLCSAQLRVIDAPSLFDVSCPNCCFNYNYHRDPTSGVFLHGHFFREADIDVDLGPDLPDT